MLDTPRLLTDPIVFNTTAALGAPKVVTLSNGNTLVAYVVVCPTSLTGQRILLGQQFDRSGNPVGEKFELIQAGVIAGPVFDIVALGNNRLVIASENPGLARNDIKITEFEITEDSIRRGETQSVRNLSLLCDVQYIRPTITAFDNDTYRVDWIATQKDGTGLEVGLVDRTFGGPDAAEVLFSKSSGTRDATLDSDTLTNGNRVLILDREGEDTADRIHFRVVGTTGSTGIFWEIGEDARNATVAALTGGGFVIAWTHVGGSSDLADIDIQFQVFNANGHATSNVITFAGDVADIDPDDDNEPAIAALGDGGFIIVYNQDDGASQVRGQRFDSEGNSVGADFLVATGNGARIDAIQQPDGNVAVTYFPVGTGNAKLVILSIDKSPVCGTHGDHRFDVIADNGNDAMAVSAARERP